MLLRSRARVAAPMLPAVVLLAVWASWLPHPVRGAEKEGVRREVRVRSNHPRIWLTPEKIERLRNKVAGLSLKEIKVLAGKSVAGSALVYVITGDAECGREAVDTVMAQRRFGHQRSLVEAALCYDWCHDLLSDREKESIRDRLVVPARAAVGFGRLWRSFANEMYSAGWHVGLVALTLHGEHPYAEEALEFVMPEWEDALKTFKHVYPDASWGEGYNYNHHTANNALRFLLALKTATDMDLITDCEYLGNNGYYMIYGVKPNGLVYPGDDNDHPAINWYEREALLMANEVFRNPHYQYFLNHCPFRRFGFTREHMWMDLLWYDGGIQERTIEELPLSKLFRGDGLVIARSGWNWDSPAAPRGDSWVTFRCGTYLSDHCHLDNNHFEIFYKGELAIDSGRYDCDWGLEMDAETIRRSQFFNYYKRSIAHNTMLICDPDEKMQMGVLNDGGQKEMIRVNGTRNCPEDYEQGTYPSDDGQGTCDWLTNPARWNTGEMLGYLSNGDFTYACGDATASYSEHKLKEFVRQFFFIRPDLVVVFDRVVSTDPDFRKTWLLHSVEEPNLLDDGRGFEVEHGRGRLVCVSVLPERREVAKVGGPGDEFLVAGIHYTCGPQSTGVPSALDYGEIPGAWRIELSPGEKALKDWFLNVILLTDRGSSLVPEVEMVSNDDEQAAVKVVGAGGTIARVTFAKAGEPSAGLSLDVDGRRVFEGRMPREIITEEQPPRR